MFASPRIVVAGGGVAALETVLALLARIPTAAVELVSADARFVNRPLSVLEPFNAGTARSLPLAELGDRGVSVVQARVTGVDPERRVLHTTGGGDRDYDALMVAVGARSRRVFDSALTFRGPRDAAALHGLVQDVEDETVGTVAFVAPRGVTWTLPLYELALQTAAHARRNSLDDVELTVVTPEQRPLEAFGRTGSALVECLLEENGIRLVAGADPEVPAAGRLRAAPGTPERRVDRIVALPQLEGIPLAGLPHDNGGFLPVDGDGRVIGVEGVYGAGDGTDHPVKQGGLAAQEADRAVDALLADLGLEPEASRDPFELRAMLITGTEIWYLRRVDGEADSEVSRRPLWWPPRKLTGRHLAPFLDARAASEPGGSVERRLAWLGR